MIPSVLLIATVSLALFSDRQGLLTGRLQVSTHLVQHCILGTLAQKTRVLITHHVEVARHADMIIVMDEGRIAQQGSYGDLRNVEGAFKTLITEYGNELHNVVSESCNEDPTMQGNAALKRGDRKSVV